MTLADRGYPISIDMKLRDFLLFLEFTAKRPSDVIPIGLPDGRVLLAWIAPELPKSITVEA